jgi:hypothetical protein
MTCRVLICDDEPGGGAQWLAEIEKAVPDKTYDLQPVPSQTDIKAAIQVLLHRRADANHSKELSKERCRFDEADVLVIDYDLLHVDENNTRYTGEGVARLARAFSQCGVVVILNQYVEAQFDLGLRGHFESFADINVDGALIGTKGLWREDAGTGFKPWHWPVLHQAARKFRERAKFLSGPKRLSTGILEMLQMTRGDAERLSDTAFGLLAPTAESYEQIAKWTFAEFLRDNSAAIETRGTEALIEKDPEAGAQIAASRVAKWLEREVLGPQDVLVDIPHLIQRCPFLLEGDMSDLGTWNRAVHGGRDVLRKIIPDAAWFKADNWLSRPAVWWQRLGAHELFQEARAGFDYSKAPDFVFLEDASCFVPMEEAKEFRADFHNIYDRRYLKLFEGIRYAPQRRLAFGGQ